jgi:hypothetical protein
MLSFDAFRYTRIGRETYENICNRIVCHFARLDANLRKNVYSDKESLSCKQVICIRVTPTRYIAPANGQNA